MISIRKQGIKKYIKEVTRFHNLRGFRVSEFHSHMQIKAQHNLEKDIQKTIKYSKKQILS
ncbi:unnamed protein product [Paramecium pentaurelia]|uniref:Uncharacterized protein n=1 Tax=Paramecium pentaurelia TaxID=43138 RepID=A0A8S1UK37_9CILI|nr:unnamed protein product [Paramecium pentaurelia]